ncbi:MAG: DUF5317 family protein [Patescibacteria group bacterium]|nr:DUF5317 family protein [Patescibacteria group bacterium]MDE2015485.1 DUF5317 family protein [Patescibacteria group bacterium]MDE2226899.1 DUF5317 family protein [Patescibacteria group bacterium]
MFLYGYFVLWFIIFALVPLVKNIVIHPIIFFVVWVADHFLWRFFSSAKLRVITVITIFTTGMLLIFSCLVLGNHQYWALKYMLPFGSALNLAVICVNGGRMPSIVRSHQRLRDTVMYRPMGSDTKLAFLADIFADIFPKWRFSFGDAVMFMSAAITAAQAIFFFRIN